MQRIRKALVPLSAALGVLGSALADGELTGAELRDVLGLAATAVLVWLIPNAE